MQRSKAQLFPLAAAIAVAACTARRGVVATLERDLHASVRLIQSGSAPVGSALEVEFVVQNDGTSTIESCFGPAFEVTFLNGHEAKGWAEMVDHPTCQQHFALNPGTSTSRRYVAKVPSMVLGLATVGGGVQVLDPRRCDRYGCDRAWLRAKHGSSVEITEGAK